ncbi:MAG: hypothetical protein HeimC3_33890 [Candidatus Heimdallarchaeota archaeon LC_3]|nr:MAG: hypothetical protein HeimC3_33890 [Candidatus Heimdallarchaeota archaeon LC_3]
MEVNNQKWLKPDFLTLAILIDIISGGLGFFIGIYMIPFLPQILDGTYFIGHMGIGNDLMSLMMTSMVVGWLLVGIPMIISGIALYQGYCWGKLLHIISWIPTLVIFPIGTIIGVFSIWLVLTQDVTLYLEGIKKNRLIK